MPKFTLGGFYCPSTACSSGGGTRFGLPTVLQKRAWSNASEVEGQEVCRRSRILPGQGLRQSALSGPGTPFARLALSPLLLRQRLKPPSGDVWF